MIKMLFLSLVIAICAAADSKVTSWEYVWEGTEKGRCRVSHKISFSGNDGDKLYAFLSVTERGKGVEKGTIA